MKQVAAILFSLLLIATQTFAAALPMRSSAPAAKRSCCSDDCQCYVGQPGAPATPPAQAPVFFAAQNQSALPPAAIVLFTLDSPMDEVPPTSSSAEFRAAATPIFERNCALLL